jgi:hypothetical protein
MAQTNSKEKYAIKITLKGNTFLSGELGNEAKPQLFTYEEAEDAVRLLTEHERKHSTGRSYSIVKMQ